jgi:hypothetical protein
MNAGNGGHSGHWGVVLGGLVIAAALTGAAVLVMSDGRSGASLIAHIKQRGGFVVYQEHGPRWLRGLLGDSYPFKSPIMATFGPDTTDEDLADVGLLPGLTLVDLSLTQVEGPGLAYLTNLCRLERLELSRSRVSDDGLEHLRELRGIRHLTLAWLPVTDVGVAHLRGLKHLQTLGLSHTRITDRSLDVLGSLPLASLDIRWTEVSTNGIAHLHRKNVGLDVQGP